MTTTIIGEDRSGGASVKKGDDFTFRFTETWNFLVLASDIGVSREEVLLDTPGLPLVGVTYTSTGARCVSISAERRTTHALYWDVRIEFETSPEQQDQDPNNVSPDPTTWIPRFSISFETYEKVLLFDLNDEPIVNSANQQFESPVTETKLICVVPFVQFEAASTSITDIMDRNNKINSGTFLGAAAETLLLNVLGAEKGWFGRYAAWRVSYQMRYDPETWELVLLDIGSVYMDGATQKIYTDDGPDGHRIWGNLDGSGGKGDNSIAPIPIGFDTYETDSFSFIRT